MSITQPVDFGPGNETGGMMDEKGAPEIGDVDIPSTTSTLAGRLGGQALYVLAGNLFTLVVGLPLQIYVARVLGSHGLGTYSLLEGMAATVATVLALGLAPAAVRFIPQYLEEGDYRAISRLLVWGAVTLLVLGIVGYASFVLALTLLHRFATVTDPLTLILMGATIPLGLLAYFAQQALRGFQMMRFIVIGSSFLQLSTKAIATVVLFALGARLAGYAAATVLAAVVAVVWLAGGVARELRTISRLPQRSRSSGQWKRYAAINFATSLISLPSSYLDRFLLGYFAGAGSVGVLAVAKQLQLLPGVIYQMLLSVGAPMFASAHARTARSEQEHLFALVTDWAVRAALPLVLFLSLFAHPILVLFGKQFADEGALPTQIFVAAQMFNLATGPNGSVAWMCGLEGQVFKVDLIMRVSTAALLVALVPFFGLTGVALSVLANSIIINVWVNILVWRTLRIRWWNRRYMGWLLPGLASAVIGVALTWFVHEWTALLLLSALLALYVVFATANLLQGLHSDDRELLAQIAGRISGVWNFPG